MKRRIYHIAALGSWLLAISLFAVSCADDMTPLDSPEGRKNGQPISFIVDDTQDWYQAVPGNTRANNQEAFAPRVIDMTSSTGEKFVLTSTVVNGIKSPGITGKESVRTRGTAKTDMKEDFGFIGYSFDSSEPLSSQVPYIYDKKAEFDSGTNSWTTTSNYYWPANSKSVQFFAYAPYGSSCGIALSPETRKGAPVIDFTVKDLVEDQIDLMTAKSNSLVYTANQKIKLPFKHNLTCIKFAIGRKLPVGARITSIKLYGVIGKGSYDMGTGLWTLSADAHDVKTYAMNNLNFDVSLGENTIITNPDNDITYTTMLMIPQTFESDEQRIEITYDAGAGDVTISAPLTGTTWLPGTTVTYNLSRTASDYTYVIEATSAQVSHLGGEAMFSVTSYRQSMSGTNKEKMPWEIVGYSFDGGLTYVNDKPVEQNWFGIAMTSGGGSTESEDGYVTVAPQMTSGSTILSEADDVSEQRRTLKNNPLKGDSYHYVDLSRTNLYGQKTKMNTANCYVINSPGYYKIPLVYGNAIVNGEANSVAYTGTPNKDYLDRTITDPYIYNNKNANNANYTPTSAVLIWQDADGVISNVKLADSGEDAGKFLYFYVDDETIAPCNAIVAVQDELGKIMWSWHIWVTNVDIYATIPVRSRYNTEYRFMPVMLGWCSLGSTQDQYDGREVLVRVRQQGGKEAVFAISQMKGIDYTKSEVGYCPYYQFGRKDPQQPSKGTVAEDKIVYGPYQPNVHNTTSKAVTLGTSIQNPQLFYGIAAQWCSSGYVNLWCAGNTLFCNADNVNCVKVVKTIYDPCPVGFHIPEADVLTNITKNLSGAVASQRTTAQINTALSETNYSSYSNGFYFWTDKSKTSTIFFPSMGARNAANGNFHRFGFASNTQYALPATTDKNGFLWVCVDPATEYQIRPYGANWTAWGMGARPVADY